MPLLVAQTSVRKEVGGDLRRLAGGDLRQAAHPSLPYVKP
jgi:hypothetical protein